MSDQKDNIKKPSKKVRLAREFRSQLITTVSTMMTSAFALVAAFAWNELIEASIAKYVPSGQTVVSKLLYVLIVTLLAVIVSFQFGKIAAHYEVEREDAEDKYQKK
jgi:uncharacterized membrane protein